uniref:C2H2-type domain-containing protein n=1 Tax=Latimeria chalumnae TaxID=7897 RepID=H3B1R6_LATCH
NKADYGMSSDTSKFKVKDFKLVKYCCNKCQFTTKSTLQYWKHLLQHGDIKFTCSYCKNVSNAKSMFQRHLVIHSGTFPYKCEYGAVRNDYSMKCTKETHDTIKRKGQCVFQHRKQKKCFIKLNTTLDGQSERQKGFFQVDLDASVLPTEVSDPEQVQNCNADSLSSNSENFKFDFFVEELEESVKLSSSATVGDSVSLVGTENGKVQVEVLSPKQVPLLPGVTLTVVAPSEFVVPEKCLAQPVEVKTVNGIQQLVLNFIPQEDVYPEFLENNTREIESLSFEKALTDCTNKSSTYSQQNTLFFQAVKSHKEIGSESINSKPLHNFKSFEKHPDPVSLASEATGKEMPFKNIDDDPTLKPNLGSEVLYQKSIHDLDQGEVNVLKIDPRLKISVLDSKVISGPQKAVKETKHNFHNAAWERISSPTRSTSSGEKLCVGKPKKSIERTSYSSNPVVPSRLEKNTDIEGIPVQNGSNSPVKLGNDIDQVELYSNNKESSEFQSTDGGSTTEGPIIVSVFSLSGGINVPEQVRWMNEHSCDQDLESKASALFQRNFKTLDEASSEDSVPLSSFCKTDILGSSSSINSLKMSQSLKKNEDVYLQQLSSGVAVVEKAQVSSFVTKEEKDNHEVKPRVPKNLASGIQVRKNDASAASFHVASPIFIPKGTVLRVLDSCNDSVQSRPCAKSRKASFHSAYHEQMLLPRPVPFSTSEYLSTSVLHSANKAKTLATSNRANERLTKQTSKQNRNCKPIKQSGLVEAKIDSDLKSTEHTCLVKSANAEKVKNCTKRKQKYSEAEGVSKKKRLNDFSFDMMTKQIRLQPLKGNQLINDPQVIPNQPVVVLNRPDIDAPAVSNVMKTTSQNKSHAVKVGLSKRTKFCHRAKQHRQSKLTPQNCKVFISVKKWPMQNMKLKNPQKNNSQVVSSDSGQPFHCTFRCWFCGRIYFNQEEWITHGQRHLTEATKDWDVLCSELQ